jgi:hypothetical protein
MLRDDRVVDWNYECFVSGKRVTRLLVVFVGSCSGRVSQPD